MNEDNCTVHVRYRFKTSSLKVLFRQLSSCHRYLSGLRCWVFSLCGVRRKGRVRIRNRPHFFPFCYGLFLVFMLFFPSIFSFFGDDLIFTLSRLEPKTETKTWPKLRVGSISKIVFIDLPHTWFEATSPPPSDVKPNQMLA
jgi:hypothetical protein